MAIKKDKYLRARGGTAHMIDVLCSNCSTLILYYQKDGPGWLKRCYLNRIFGPKELAAMQKDPGIKTEANLPKLACSCGNIIGYPMTHKDGRLAFRLERGNFIRKRSKVQKPE